MLPGLKCLKVDMALIAPEHEEVVNSIIKDYENKMELSKSERSGSLTSGTPPSDDMRSRMMNRIKDTTSKANLSNIFTRKK
ncbi:hypothetical protein FSP39_019311 [Pinctada imbricata]|uniref:Uncharacterized protein n=1 Tax=Pinctada imbricata TaxID=66713 RepID=A0AA89BPM9_PINIB|nr:hypothetical protein FSP39_019311 [Pinctada imbricata]